MGVCFRDRSLGQRDGWGPCKVMGHSPQPYLCCQLRRGEVMEGSKAAPVVGDIWPALFTRQSRLSHLRVSTECLEIRRGLACRFRQTSPTPRSYKCLPSYGSPSANMKYLVQVPAPEESGRLVPSVAAVPPVRWTGTGPFFPQPHSDPAPTRHNGAFDNPAIFTRFM